jgi:hypothetical protein
LHNQATAWTAWRRDIDLWPDRDAVAVWGFRRLWNLYNKLPPAIPKSYAGMVTLAVARRASADGIQRSLRYQVLRPLAV